VQKVHLIGFEGTLYKINLFFYKILANFDDF